MTLAPLTSHRSRCPFHGLLLDDRGHCSRCASGVAAVEGRRAFGAIVRLAFVLGAFIVVVGAVLHGYRIVSSLPRSTATATKAASGDAKLVVYTTKTCPACRMARKYMDGHDIAYQERDVEDPAVRAELARVGGSGGVPTFVVDGEVLSGFDPRGIRLEDALERHGMR